MDDVMSNYKKVINVGDNEVLVVYYLKKLGMLYEKNGNMVDVKFFYEWVKFDFLDFLYVIDIDKYIIRVVGE